MTTDRPAEYLASLVRELCALPRETEWVETQGQRSRAAGDRRVPLGAGERGGARGQGLRVPGVGCARRGPRHRRNHLRAARRASRQRGAGELAAAPPGAEDRLPLLHRRDRQAPRRPARNRAGGPPPGAFRGAGVHPRRDLQEEAQGLSGERTRAVAYLRPDSVRGRGCHRARDGRRRASPVGLPSLLRSAGAAAAGEPRGHPRRAGGRPVDPQERRRRLERHEPRRHPVRQRARCFSRAGAQSGARDPVPRQRARGRR